MKNKYCSRSLLLLIIAALTISLIGCSLFDADDVNDDKKRSTSRSNSKKASIVQSDDDSKLHDNYENLVINDFKIKAEDYFIETRKGSDYIFLSSEIITYPFKLPYSVNEYPELSTENGQISITWWDDNSDILLKIDMFEDSHEAYINDYNDPIDIGMGPVTRDNKLFIPVNLIIQALKMKETYDSRLHATIIYYGEDFPKDLLLGQWSDNDTNLFTEFKDFATGAKSLSSFAIAYQFDKNGTYKMVLISVGGYKDALIQLTGKYKILGNTIVYYDTVETLYEGTPLKLVHKNQKREKPFYEFITDYDPKENRLEIGSFWLYKVD